MANTTFRPKAKLVSMLGESLISDNSVGLYELVKNSYDADASSVLVELTDTKTQKKTALVIRDDGTGMTTNDLLEKWMTPANPHKAETKHGAGKTEKGRTPLGEKGIGRFAVHKLGRKLTLITRCRGEQESVLSVNWDQFDEDVFLDEIEIAIEQREPQEFLEEQTGTKLVITEAREQWTEDQVKAVQQNFRRLQLPSDEAERDFSIELRCPDYPALENIDSNEILENSHYSFEAIVDEYGLCSYTYSCNHPGLGTPTESAASDVNLFARTKRPDKKKKSSCGLFKIKLYVWDRTARYLRESGISTADLDRQCGVGLYRDRMRVLPYGKSGNDWLLLDKSRINDPSGKIANNQMIGFVYFEQTAGGNLKDTTSREGLQENQAFLDLEALVKGAILEFTNLWKKDRPGKTNPKKEKQIGKALAGLENLKGSIEDLEPDERKEHEETVELLSVLLKSEEEKSAKLKDLASTGLMAERASHEFTRLFDSSWATLRKLKIQVAEAEGSSGLVDDLSDTLKVLANELRNIVPEESRGRDRKRKCSIPESVRAVIAMSSAKAKKSGVKLLIEGDDEEWVKSMRRSAFIQVLGNLLDNGIYWAAHGEDARVVVKLIPSAQTIIVVDTGPGIESHHRQHIFDQNFTVKEEGYGLGLWLARDLTERVLGGRLIDLAEDLYEEFSLPAEGAAFKLTFNSQ